MKTLIIYSGHLRTWEQVKDNHAQCLAGDTCFRKPKSILKPSVALSLNAAGETSIVNTLNQWNNRFKAFQTAKKGYDVYVICRPDIRFSGPITFEVVPGKIYIPEGNDYRDGINDQFAFGDYEAMKWYCDLINHYREYFNEGLIFHPETYLKRHLGSMVIRIPQSNEIVRP